MKPARFRREREKPTNTFVRKLCCLRKGEQVRMEQALMVRKTLKLSRNASVESEVDKPTCEQLSLTIVILTHYFSD